MNPEGDGPFFFVLNWICGSKSLSLPLAFRISIYSMDFCVQPPVKMSICAEKLLINPSQNVSPLSPKPAAISGPMALKRTPMFCLALPASGVLYHGLITVIFDIHPSLDPLRFLLKVSFPLQIQLCRPIKILCSYSPKMKPCMLNSWRPLS